MSLTHTVKTLATGTPVLITGGVPKARAGDEYLAYQQREFTVPETIKVSSPAFKAGEPIPLIHSADYGNISPPLHWENVPSDARSLVLIVEDPDAPLPKPFVHWLAYNIPVNRDGLPQELPPNDKTIMLQGKNSNLKLGWTGMAPPKKDTAHHYHFAVFALDQKLSLDHGSGRSALLKAMQGHVIAKGEVVGTFQNK